MGYKFGVDTPPHERYPVAWYSPTVLWQSAQRLVFSINFQRNADRRELFADSLQIIDLSAQTSVDGSFGFDYVSDTGDGGNATYTVAQGVLAATLRAVDQSGQAQEFAEGRLLVFGGDLAYPGASSAEYQYRFAELFECAHYPAAVRGDGLPKKFIAAIPQNHDWFDSLSSFARTFIRKDWVLGYQQSPQHRQQHSYFAIKLPNRWWMLGFDFALTHDIDGQQLDIFRNQIAPQLAAGDKVMLVYPEPFWTRPLGDNAHTGYPKRYQRLEHTLEEKGVRIALRVAGDLHHYLRQSVPCKDAASIKRDQLVTCGAGGAFLHPTHAKRMQTGCAVDRNADLSAAGKHRQGRVRVGHTAPCTSQLECAYPPAAASRAYAWGNLWALFQTGRTNAQGFWRRMVQRLNSNFGFALLLGLLYWFNSYTNALPFAESFRPDDFKPMYELSLSKAAPLWLHAMVFSPFGLLINVLMIAGCVMLTREERWYWGITGLVHGLLHGVLVFFGYWFASHVVLAAIQSGWALLDWCQHGIGNTCHSFLTGVLVFVWGALVGSLLFGLYLCVMGLLGRMPNNSYGTLAVEDYKGFMRFHIDASGKLTARFLGVDQVPRQWTRNADPNARPLWSADAPQTPQWRVVDEFLVE
jgi:hypothetical protein